MTLYNFMYKNIILAMCIASEINGRREYKISDAYYGIFIHSIYLFGVIVAVIIFIFSHVIEAQTVHSVRATVYLIVLPITLILCYAQHRYLKKTGFVENIFDDYIKLPDNKKRKIKIRGYWTIACNSLILTLFLIALLLFR